DAASGWRVRRKFKALRPIADRPDAMVHLGEVVVFGGEPEDGHGGGAGSAEIRGAPGGMQGRIKRVFGTREKAGLVSRGAVAGGDDGGAGCEAIEGSFD